MKLLKVLSTALDRLARLEIQVWNGKSRTYTAKEIGPYGTDSNPIKDMQAIYATTEMDGAEVVIGYLNKSRLAEAGEHRIYATNATDTHKFSLWLRADGTALFGDSEIPADYTNFFVMFNELKTEFNELKGKYNDLATKFNAHTHIYSPGGGAPVPTAAPVSAASQSTANIDNAKHTKIKTKS